MWPDDATQWDPGRNTIIFTTRDKKTMELRFGDQVALSGGYGTKPQKWVSEPSSSCPTDMFVVSQVQ